jgi:hypothetical protein
MRKGAVRLARSLVVKYSNATKAGAAWIASLASVKPYSTIAGEAILWGDALRYGPSPKGGGRLELAEKGGEVPRSGPGSADVSPAAARLIMHSNPPSFSLQPKWLESRKIFGSNGR